VKERRQMTIAELIATLSEYPPDMRVLVNGYEGGFDDAFFDEPKLYRPDPTHKSWDGAYLEAKADDAAPGAFMAVKL